MHPGPTADHLPQRPPWPSPNTVVAMADALTTPGRVAIGFDPQWGTTSGLGLELGGLGSDVEPLRVGSPLSPTFQLRMEQMSFGGVAEAAAPGADAATAASTRSMPLTGLAFPVQPLTREDEAIIITAFESLAAMAGAQLRVAPPVLPSEAGPSSLPTTSPPSVSQPAVEDPVMESLSSTLTDPRDPEAAATTTVAQSTEAPIKSFIAPVPNVSTPMDVEPTPLESAPSPVPTLITNVPLGVSSAASTPAPSTPPPDTSLPPSQTKKDSSPEPDLDELLAPSPETSPVSAETALQSGQSMVHSPVTAAPAAVDPSPEIDIESPAVPTKRKAARKSAAQQKKPRVTKPRAPHATTSASTRSRKKIETEDVEPAAAADSADPTDAGTSTAPSPPAPARTKARPKKAPRIKQPTTPSSPAPIKPSSPLTPLSEQNGSIPIPVKAGPKTRAQRRSPLKKK